jgi:aerobic carbon-monoxide dehydrogenase large subunit
VEQGVIGQRIRRKEDRRLITGTGRYVADVKLEGTVEAAFLRSSFPHARILSIDTSDATSERGAIKTLTARDIEGKIEPFTRFVDQEHTPPQIAEAVNPIIKSCPIECLASDRVRYVGQPIAVLVAGTRYQAEDALELIHVDYEPLDIVVDPEKAVEGTAPLIHDHLGDNVQADFEVDVGDVEKAFSEADVTLSIKIRTPRVAANPLEARGILARFDAAREEMTIWMSTQVPHMVRTRVSEMLHLDEEKIRVIAPDVGGGFGPKVNIYPEDLIVPYLAMVLGRPVRWIEDRREHLLSTAHSRDQVHTVQVACTSEGRVTAIQDAFLLDCGAYNPFSLTSAYNTAAHFRGPYAIPNYRIRGRCVLTNKMPNVPYRGAGRPEAVFAMDRVIDEVAHKLRIDPAEVRMRNLIRPEDMPYDQGMLYRDGGRVVYDGGDYPAALKKAMEMVDYSAVRARQDAASMEGTRLGVGLSCYIEGTGIGPYEGALVRVHPSGEVVAYVGSAPHGQSHETTFAQICADALSAPVADVTVKAGDTGLIPHGVGTFASRSAVTAGTAVVGAAGRVRQKILAVASMLLEADPEDLVLKDGHVATKGAPGRSLSFAEIAHAAAPGPKSKVPEGMDPGLEATYYFVPPTVTYSYGAHAAVIEVDAELGSIELKRYAVVHDSGTIINPTVVEGQIHGGVAQGIGCALYEEMVYDEEGQPLTSTFMDYLLPTAMEIPHVDQDHQESLTDRNPLGIRGVGEGGTISPPAAIANALADAYRSMPFENVVIPLTPERVWTAIRNSPRQAKRVDRLTDQNE